MKSKASGSKLNWYKVTLYIAIAIANEATGLKWLTPEAQDVFRMIGRIALTLRTLDSNPWSMINGAIRSRSKSTRTSSGTSD